MPEQRRTFRKRAFMAAYVLAIDAPTPLFCLVRDMSQTGARLELSEGTVLPGTFELHITGRRRVYRAEVIWRRAEEVGIRFLARASAPGTLPLSRAC